MFLVNKVSVLFACHFTFKIASNSKCHSGICLLLLFQKQSTLIQKFFHCS
uniref:Uncharacterized protein n=1 Tax=Macaca fascicularis TaxID=9541 RepID=A0A7N9D1S0_MACFA